MNSEDDTFNALRRQPVMQTFLEFINFCDGRINITEEQMEEFFNSKGWTGEEFDMEMNKINPSRQI